MGLRKVASSVAVQYVGRAFGLICSLGTVAILTRYLGVAGYGEYVTVMAVAGLVIAFSDFGFFWSTIHNLGDNTDRAQALRELEGIRTVSTVIALSIGAIFIWAGNYSAGVEVAYLVLTIFILSSSANGVLVAAYQSEYEMVRPTISELAARLLNLCLVWFGVFSHASFTYFIVAVSLAATINLFLNWLGLARRYGYILPQILGFRWAKYYRSVFILGVVQIIYVTFYRVDVILLSWLKPAVDVGIYGVATKISELISTGSSLFVGALFPLLVASYQSDRAGYLLQVKKSLGLMLVVAIPIGILGQFFTTDLVRLIGGSEFVAATTITAFGRAITASQALSLVLLFCLLNYCSVVFYTALLASKQLRALMTINIIALFTNILLNLALIPKFSYLATSATTVATEVVVLALVWGHFGRRFSDQMPWRWILRVAVATLPALGFLLLAPGLLFVWRLLVASTLYLLTLRLIAWPKAIIAWRDGEDRLLLDRGE